MFYVGCEALDGKEKCKEVEEKEGCCCRRGHLGAILKYVISGKCYRIMEGSLSGNKRGLNRERGEKEGILLKDQSTIFCLMLQPVLFSVFKMRNMIRQLVSSK